MSFIIYKYYRLKNTFNQLFTSAWFLIILINLFPHHLFGQDFVLSDVKEPSFIEKLNESRPVRFRNDTIMVKPRWFIPDHYKLQFAGNIGFLSFGAGYNVRDIYEFTLLYGLVNETLGDSKTTVSTVSIKNNFKLVKQPLFNHFYPKAGLAINWGHTNNTFNKLPEHYPNKYYFQNKVHIAPLFGGEWIIPLKDKHLKAGSVYFELSTLDAYLLECLRTEYIHFSDIWNIALGITLYIH